MAASSHSREGAFVQIQEKGFWQRQPTFLKDSAFDTVAYVYDGVRHREQQPERNQRKTLLGMRSVSGQQTLGNRWGRMCTTQHWAWFCLSSYLWRAGVDLGQIFLEITSRENSN